MKTIMLLFICSLFYYNFASADFINSNDFKGTSQEVIIDNLIVDRVTFEEPLFSDRRLERDIAQMTPDLKPNELETQGQLVVLKEIPFTYSQISHSALEARVLNELENSGK